MSPEVYNLSIYEGDTYTLKLELLYDETTPIDLTGHTIKMQIRNDVESLSYQDFTPYITNGGANGQINVVVPYTETVDWGYTSGVYDLEMMTPSNELFTIIYGTVNVIKQVTR